MEQTLNNILELMDRMSYADLQVIGDAVGKIQNKRNQQRSKELWGNAIAAIQKYEKEFGDIELYDEDTERSFNVLPNISADKPGILQIYEN